MISNKPGATSTPLHSLSTVRGRKAIREHDSIQSPINFEEGIRNMEYELFLPRSGDSKLGIPERILESASPQNMQMDLSPCPSDTEEKAEEKEDEEEEDEEEEDEEKKVGKTDDFQDKPNAENRKVNQSSSNLVVVGALGVFFCILIAVLVRVCDNYSSNAVLTTPEDLHTRFKTLKGTYVKQKQDFWRQIKVQIEEIPVLNQPRSIIFLYEKGAKDTMRSILNEVSDVGLCYLSECSNLPVRIEGSELNTSAIINDYGRIIAKYRDELESSGVMMVNNLQQVPGKSAQAFHSFCDEYTPVVKKALILFTLQVDRLPEGYPVPFVERFLLDLWKDIGVDDKFHPLFTRISGTVLTVEPE